MTQEVLKLALEALDTIVDAIYINSQQEAEAVLKANDAIAAIKEALAQRKPPTVDVRILQAVSDEYNAWIRAHASGMGYDDFLLQRLAAHDIKENT